MCATASHHEQRFKILKQRFNAYERKDMFHQQSGDVREQTLHAQVNVFELSIVRIEPLSTFSFFFLNDDFDSQ